jgi:hypothetical protein
MVIRKMAIAQSVATLPVKTLFESLVDVFIHIVEAVLVVH